MFFFFFRLVVVVVVVVKVVLMGTDVVVVENLIGASDRLLLRVQKAPSLLIATSSLSSLLSLP